MRRAWVIVRKEWAEVFKNRFVLFTVAFLPIILTALPLFFMASNDVAESLGDLGTSGVAGTDVVCEGLNAAECPQYFLVSQFLLMFMLMPLAIPVTIAAYSIVGEKSTKTLEPVLATPITSIELLTGKALAAAIPAVVVSWLGFLIFVIGASFLAAGPGVMEKIISPLWLLAILLVGPLLSVASVNVAMMVSSRANDPRVAEQLSMLVIFPLLALFFGQVAGLVLVNEKLVLWMAVFLVLADIGLLAFATQLFQRETILTRWK
jgi:ABC-2 type transport system permease protein